MKSTKTVHQLVPSSNECTPKVLISTLLPRVLRSSVYNGPNKLENDATKTLVIKKKDSSEAAYSNQA